jgi:serine-type D-Ala-D-Ala carboxypeptidase (penicillin-binding protein 5/6)
MGRRSLAAAVLFCLAFAAAGALLLWPEDGGEPEPAVTISGSEGEVAPPLGQEGEPEGPGAVEASGGIGGDRSLDALGSIGADEIPGNGAFAVETADPPYLVTPRFKQPPGAGLLFDVDTGEVLWARNPAVERPIASLTKMMTALIIAEDHGPRERVAISPKAPGVEGSRIGVLKPGSRVPLQGLFLGLLMVSGNDAAVALAEHDAQTVNGFVKRMNRRALDLGLACTRFAGPAGLQDTGNGSCAYDLAALARADLANPRVAAVTARRSAEIPFPVKGGSLSLANNHYFVQSGVDGLPKAQVTGVKTGLTNGAGRCYVTTARLGGRHLGVVLLDSEDPIKQVPALLRAGFAAG